MRTSALSSSASSSAGPQRFIAALQGLHSAAALLNDPWRRERTDTRRKEGKRWGIRPIWALSGAHTMFECSAPQPAAVRNLSAGGGHSACRHSARGLAPLHTPSLHFTPVTMLPPPGGQERFLPPPGLLPLLPFAAAAAACRRWNSGNSTSLRLRHAPRL